MINFFWFLNVMLFENVATSKPPAVNTLYTPDVREMELIFYFQKREGLDLSSYHVEFMKVDVEIGRKKVRYHFAHNKKIGRCDIFLNDHWTDQQLFIFFPTFKFTFSEIKLNAKETKIYETEIKIQASPNSFEVIHTKDTKDFKFTVKLRLTCDSQFESMNCGLKKNEGETVDLKRDPSTGKLICKNPATCLNSQKCDSTDKHNCGQESQCWKNYKEPGTFYCVCKEGFGGKTCNLVRAQLTEELMLFAPAEEMPNLIHENVCTGCPSTCQKIASFIICDSKGSDENAFVCTDGCFHVCGERFCRNKQSDGTKTYFLKNLNPNQTQN